MQAAEVRMSGHLLPSKMLKEERGNLIGAQVTQDEPVSPHHGVTPFKGGGQIRDQETLHALRCCWSLKVKFFGD